MVANVGEGDARRDAGSTGERRAQRRLTDAVAMTRLQHPAGPVDLDVAEISADVRQIADEAKDGASGVLRAGTVGAQPFGLGDDGRMVAVDVLGGSEKRRPWSAPESGRRIASCRGGDCRAHDEAGPGVQAAAGPSGLEATWSWAAASPGGSPSAPGIRRLSLIASKPMTVHVPLLAR